MSKVNASDVRSKRANEADLALRLSTGLLITIAVAIVGIRMIGMFGILDETIALSSFDWPLHQVRRVDACECD
jgi:F0F1-type ATP synthase membrane subunit a